MPDDSRGEEDGDLSVERPLLGKQRCGGGLIDCIKSEAEPDERVQVGRQRTVMVAGPTYAVRV